MTKIDLITGILGAGKTTFLLKYARRLLDKGLRIAILVNDFGAVNVDMLILSELSCENCRLEMIAGTADPCCHKRRFKTQLISLGMEHFDRVIVEPSGIFDIDEFFDILHESPLDRWFEIGSVIGIIDSETENSMPEHMEYLFASEASCCGKLAVSKLEDTDDISAVSSAMLDHLNRSLADIKCSRTFTEKDLIARPFEKLTDADLDSLTDAGWRGASYVKKFRPEDILSSVHYFMHLTLPADRIAPVINSIFSDEKCGHIYRIKGSVLTPEKGWLKINAQPDNTEIVPIKDGQSVLIVIGDDVSKQLIDRYLTEFNSDSEYVSI